MRTKHEPPLHVLGVRVSRYRRRTCAAASGLMLAFAAGCGTADDSADERTHSTDVVRGETSSPHRSPGPDAAGETTPEDDMRIEITIGDERFRAALDDSAASRDLVDQLPLTLDMTDHGSVEKTGALPSALSRRGQPEGAGPGAGDIGYYAPGNDLVLYYGDQSYYPGIVVIGHLDGDAADRLAAMDGTVSATVAIIDD